MGIRSNTVLKVESSEDLPHIDLVLFQGSI